MSAFIQNKYTKIGCFITHLIYASIILKQKNNRFVQVSTLIVILAIKPFHGCDYFQNVEVGKSYEISSPEYNREVCRWTAQAPEGHILVLECDVVYIPLVRLQFRFFFIFLFVYC